MTPKGRHYYYFHITDEKTELRDGTLTCPESSDQRRLTRKILEANSQTSDPE